MIPALLATLLFAFSSVSAKRSVHHLGSNNASFVRILVATSLLAIYAHSWGAGLSGVGLPWFIVSGFIGYGICDTAIFLALPRLGAQLTSLMVQCLAAPIAALTEWIWHHRELRPMELLAGAAILVASGITSFLLDYKSILRSFSGLSALFTKKKSAENDPLAEVECPEWWFPVGFGLLAPIVVTLMAFLFKIPVWAGLVAVPLAVA